MKRKVEISKRKMLESRKNATLEENVGEKSKLKKNVEIGKKESESDEKC